jgi:GNAT superfamily N-acetyltransferase
VTSDTHRWQVTFDTPTPQGLRCLPVPLGGSSRLLDLVAESHPSTPRLLLEDRILRVRLLLVAVDWQGRDVGVVALEEPAQPAIWSALGLVEVCEVGMLSVARTERRRGIGRFLVQVASARAQQLPVTRVTAPGLAAGIFPYWVALGRHKASQSGKGAVYLYRHPFIGEKST